MIKYIIYFHLNNVFFFINKADIIDTNSEILMINKFNHKTVFCHLISNMYCVQHLSCVKSTLKN